jgi:hypothetical protein
MTTDKQDSPNESGPYMVSDFDSNIWTPATYDAAANIWMQYSPFSGGNGWYEISAPDKWMKCQ